MPGGNLVSIGFGNAVAVDKVVAIVVPDSSPIKRIKEDARNKGKLIDATHGRKTRAVIVTESDHVILSAIQSETVMARFNNRDCNKSEDK
ncbi:MAG: DUF370 domain-containing protein [bacterium]